MITAPVLTPAPATDFIDLANNENPWGPSPAVIEAIHTAARLANRYPDRAGLPLLGALAEHFQFDTNRFMLGNGSGELIDLVARQWARPGAEVIVPSPSFIPYTTCAKRAGAQVVSPGLKDWQFDLEAALEMVSDKTSVIILANPNNPTGMQLSRETLEEWLRAVPENVLVVLDEAYAEYGTDQNLGPALLQQHHNLLVLRTFSKAYGLAGLRIGYAIGQPSVISALQSQRQQYHVNRIAQAAALAALMDQAHLRRALHNNSICLEKFCAGLDHLEVGHLPSCANFVLVYCGRSSATAEALQAYGLIVKPLERFGLPEFIRVSIGLPEVIDHLLSAIKTIQREQPWFPVWGNAAISPPQPCLGEKSWRY